MKKNKILKWILIGIFIILLIILMRGFFQKETLNLGKTQEGYKKIVELKSGKRIFTSYDKIVFKSKYNFTMPLSLALKLQLITINEIIDHMEVESAFNDGGTIIYHYKASDNFANKDFYLCNCNSFINNRDVYIFETLDIENIPCIH